MITGTSPLPVGAVGAVYFSWPDPNAPPNWQYLGYISNKKRSDIFKLSQLKKLDEVEANRISNAFNVLTSHTARVGIFIESETTVVQLEAAPMATSREDSFTTATSMIQTESTSAFSRIMALFGKKKRNILVWAFFMCLDLYF